MPPNPNTSTRAEFTASYLAFVVLMERHDTLDLRRANIHGNRH